MVIEKVTAIAMSATEAATPRLTFLRKENDCSLRKEK